MEGWFMKNLDKANEWLQRAKSNMARAKAGRVSPDILNEDLCYDAQQAVEKAFKSVCIIHEIVFPKTHDIAYLIELLEKGGVEVPENLQNAKILTAYAVETRYPGDYEPVDKRDLKKAVAIAKEVLKWVKKEIDVSQRPPDPQKSLFE
jgi:HEPN domain-containing protein